MNRLIKVMALVVVAITMFACSSNTPSGVAEKAVRCLQDRDYEGYVELIYLPEREGVDVAEQKQQFAAMLKEKAGKSLETEDGIKSYEILSEEISDDGETAGVEVKIIYGNGEEKSQTIKLRKDEQGDWKLDCGK